MSVLLSVSESPYGVSLDAISLNSNKNFSSYLMWTDGRTDYGEFNSSPSSLREAGNKKFSQGCTPSPRSDPRICHCLRQPGQKCWQKSDPMLPVYKQRKTIRWYSYTQTCTASISLSFLTCLSWIRKWTLHRQGFLAILHQKCFSQSTHLLWWCHYVGGPIRTQLRNAFGRESANQWCSLLETGSAFPWGCRT